MTRRHLVAAVLAASLLAGGCSDSDSGSDAAVTTTAAAAQAGPLTLPVSVDALPEDFSASFFAYFPQQLTARPGDTVQFTSSFTGEPHTVAFGTVIDEALNALAAIPAGTPIPQQVQDLLSRVPPFFSTTDTRVDADPIPAAAQPCFLTEGLPPAQEACPGQLEEPPAFTGRQTFYSSGFLPDEATFEVELADDIAPGSYRFMCLVNRTEMTGILNVQPKGTSITGPADLLKQAETEIAQAIGRTRPRAEQVRSTTTPDTAVAGAPDLAFQAPIEGQREVTSTVNVFPTEVSVPAGGAVSWTLNGAHMIAFNAPEDARPLYAIDADGVVRANKKGANPSGSPPRPPGASVVDGGPFDGSGFKNSGLLVGEGDLTYRLTFTQPGTYQYRCLFHTEMEGSVKVG